MRTRPTPAPRLAIGRRLADAETGHLEAGAATAVGEATGAIARVLAADKLTARDLQLLGCGSIPSVAMVDDVSVRTLGRIAAATGRVVRISIDREGKGARPADSIRVVAAILEVEPAP